MRFDAAEQEKRLLPFVVAACNSVAAKYGLDPRDGYGYVLCKVLERLDRITKLAKPLEGYVIATVWPEARRFFKGKNDWGGWQKED
jgi:hypothetical protein